MLAVLDQLESLDVTVAAVPRAHRTQVARPITWGFARSCDPRAPA